MDFESVLRPVEPAAFDADAVGAIQGWLDPSAADMTERVARLQRALGSVTGILELGVFKGRYLSLLNALYQDAGVPVVGVDAFMSMREPLAAKWRDSAMAEILASAAKVAPNTPAPVLVAGFTRDVRSERLLELCPAKYSFVSIDAGHELDDVRNDFALVEGLLSDGGVIAADDAFNFRVPGVCEGMCRYFFENTTTKLAPFAAVGNKLFFCRHGMHSTYLAYMNWILDNFTERSYIKATAAIREDNRHNLFAPHMFGHEIVAFTWD